MAAPEGLNTQLGAPPAMPPVTAPKAPKPKQKPKKRDGHYQIHGTDGKQLKLQPSMESGGVPTPSPQYLAVSQGPVIRLEQPQNLLLVIDLNGTLLFRPDKKKPKNFVARPNADLFLNYCLETFSVLIWSSAKGENVTPMCDTLLTPEQRSKIIAVWGREKFKLSAGDYDKRVICFKRLTTVWSDSAIASSHPERAYGRIWDQSNTILIDDTAEKAKSEPHNILEVPEWSGDMTDNVLPVVHDYINNLSMHSNVSTVLRNNSFVEHLAQKQHNPLQRLSETSTVQGF
ncbi:HAD-like domain-containing protein [Calycina marina]|uniref:Mitochondrial import inner membrane translocase subunit TIM50 n=1 Tax=Calycina marina TaxID=1763456 RepID=A0A9P7ZAG4_9HELO|nr:HAD-like domain-containing protein [Calycina marina]